MATTSRTWPDCRRRSDSVTLPPRARAEVADPFRVDLGQRLEHVDSASDGDDVAHLARLQAPQRLGDTAAARRRVRRRRLGDRERDDVKLCEPARLLEQLVAVATGTVDENHGRMPATS